MHLLMVAGPGLSMFPQRGVSIKDTGVQIGL